MNNYILIGNLTQWMVALEDLFQSTAIIVHYEKLRLTQDVDNTSTVLNQNEVFHESLKILSYYTMCL